MQKHETSFTHVGRSLGWSAVSFPVPRQLSTLPLSLFLFINFVFRQRELKLKHLRLGSLYGCCCSYGLPNAIVAAQIVQLVESLLRSKNNFQSFFAWISFSFRSRFYRKKMLFAFCRVKQSIYVTKTIELSVLHGSMSHASWLLNKLHRSSLWIEKTLSTWTLISPSFSSWSTHGKMSSKTMPPTEPKLSFAISQHYVHWLMTWRLETTKYYYSLPSGCESLRVTA